MKLRNLFLAIILLFALNANAQQPAFLPQFKFFKLDGKPYSNVNINQSKKTLFILFDCTCEHCQREAKELNSVYSKLKNINILMVTFDESISIQKFFGSYAPGLNLKPNVTVLQDKNKTFIPTFLPSQYPAMYLYSTAGKLLVYNSGDGGIKKVLKSI
ncbi:TlpA family protein disulfide reductase [Pedobacter rhodius]|uniref:Redoxin domain-containing protein n=1 Tax=Pedobacter rhodius TaxID=3004098 RepID=A0ABT4KTP2_9SPHI|nr:redoxin domain-containing protein [Pedobacter sp. SJ11]MCZ4222296.1 redoxin domain-containing protein [Pedobacter sp. SJ11]